MTKQIQNYKFSFKVRGYSNILRIISNDVQRTSSDDLFSLLRSFSFLDIVITKKT